MNALRTTTALAVVAILLAISQPASAAPMIDIGRPGPRIGIPRPTLPPSPPTAVGGLTCSNGILFGNFTDLDQDDDTLRVYGISADDVPTVEYPAVRAWGGWMVYLPTDNNLVNLVAYDDHGKKATHRSIYMRSTGFCE